MIKNVIITVFFVVSCLNAQYCAGDTISEADQNIVHIVGAGVEGHETGSEFRLADFNGALNGGDYSIIFIDMSASW